jgi:hypothetical protein
MPLSPEDLKAFKKPFGLLIPDDQVTKVRLLAVLKNANLVITVGDATTQRLAEFGVIPDLAVIDGRERRSRRDYPTSYKAVEVRCTNPAGSITRAAIDVLEKSLRGAKPVRVLVEGEEDLLALPIFVMAPEGSVVLYGQPLEGLVVVKIDEAKRKEAKDLMSRITID